MKLALSTRVLLSYCKWFGGIKFTVMRTNFNPSTQSRRGRRNVGLDAEVLCIYRRIQYMSPCSCRIVSKSDLPYFRFRAPEIAGDIRFRHFFDSVSSKQEGYSRRDNKVLYTTANHSLRNTAVAYPMKSLSCFWF